MLMFLETYFRCIRVFDDRTLDLFLNIAQKWTEELDHCKFNIIHNVTILYIIKEERIPVC